VRLGRRRRLSNRAHKRRLRNKALLAYTHVFSPTLVNVAHAGFNYLNTTRESPEAANLVSLPNMASRIFPRFPRTAGFQPWNQRDCQPWAVTPSAFRMRSVLTFQLTDEPLPKFTPSTRSRWVSSGSTSSFLRCNHRDPTENSTITADFTEYQAGLASSDQASTGGPHSC